LSGKLGSRPLLLLWLLLLPTNLGFPGYSLVKRSLLLLPLWLLPAF
jgi:hypothetical protein